MPPKPTTRSTDSIERHARWLFDWTQDHLTASYLEAIRACQKTFEIGESAAKAGYKRMREIQHERWSTETPQLRDRIAERLAANAARARARGDDRGEVRALDVLARVTGASAPQEVKHSGGIDLAAKPMSELLEAAGVARGILQRAADRGTLKLDNSCPTNGTPTPSNGSTHAKPKS